jgi:hypothetical protein
MSKADRMAEGRWKEHRDKLATGGPVREASPRPGIDAPPPA